MYRLLLLIVFFIPGIAGGQLLPKEGAALHYRLIGFSDPQVSSSAGYMLQVALGNYSTEDSFLRHVVVTRNLKKNSAIAEVPLFGKQYTWRIVPHSNTTQPLQGKLFHFSTTSIPDVDTDNTRLRVIKSGDLYKNALVFMDGNKGIYDMKGNPIWYLPKINELSTEQMRDVRDMKLSPQGTITFLLNNIAYEINYNGDILWKAPNDGKVSKSDQEYYHHEFTKLTNGNYMVLGEEYVMWQLSPLADSNVTREAQTVWDSVHKAYYQKIEFGTLIEYDKQGNVLWSWRSYDYFRNSDLQDAINGIGKLKDVHENAFYFDEKKNELLISFRNVNRIVKISYPGGQVLNTYGEYSPKAGNNLFCNQHSCKRSMDGYLYLFNNNGCDKQGLPKIVMMEEPKEGSKDPLKKKWEYTCELQGNSLKRHFQFRSGGNVIELPDRSIFTSLSTDLYSNVFIVNKGKQILWSAMPEKWDQVETKWKPVFQYRASIVTQPKEIEQLIWNGTIK